MREETCGVSTGYTSGHSGHVIHGTLSDTWFGEDCTESLSENAKMKRVERCIMKIRIEYVAPVKLLVAEDMLGNFDCCRIVKDCERLGEKSYCYFLYPKDDDGEYISITDWSEKLVIAIEDYGGLDLDWEIIELKSISKPGEDITIMRKDQPANLIWTAPTFTVLTLGGLVLVCFCCVCAACFIAFACSVCCLLSLPVLSSCGCCVCLQGLRINKFEKLEDFDIILQEQQAEKKGLLLDGRKSMSDSKFEIDSKLFEIEFAEVKLLKVLGAGGSGATVYLAKWAGKKVAFKVFKTKDFSGQRQLQDFQKEVDMMSIISHPNILQFYGCSLREPRLGIVMEFCENGDLKGFIKLNSLAGKDSKVDLETKFRILEETCAGMLYLHNKGMIHRDLKCENVLLDKSFTCKVIDFGLSKMKEQNESVRMTKHVGTSHYMAPEVVMSPNYGPSCDVFSYGIMMYEIFGDTLFPYGEDMSGNFGIEMQVALDPAFRPDVNANVLQGCPSWATLLMQKCWDHHPETRPTFQEISRIVKERLEEEKVRPKTTTNRKDEEEVEGEEEEKIRRQEIDGKKEERNDVFVEVKERKEEDLRMGKKEITLFDHTIEMMRLRREIRGLEMERRKQKRKIERRWEEYERKKGDEEVKEDDFDAF